MIFIYLFLGILGAFLLFLLAITVYVGWKTVHPHRYTRSELLEQCVSKGYFDASALPPRTELEFRMKDGYVIHGDASFVEGSNKYILFCHGHGANRESSRGYALLFRELGYNTIVYDHRGHGDNVRTDIKMGAVESRDLAQIISQVYDRFGPDIQLGLHGVSMGAATVLLTLQYTQHLAFVVEDCGYSNLKTLLKELITSYHLPGFLFPPFLEGYFRLFHGFRTEESSPELHLQNNRVPVLIIHGTADTLVDPKNAQRIADALPGKKQVVMIAGGRHARSVLINEERYKEALKTFLKECESVEGV